MTTDASTITWLCLFGVASAFLVCMVAADLDDFQDLPICPLRTSPTPCRITEYRLHEKSPVSTPVAPQLPLCNCPGMEDCPIASRGDPLKTVTFRRKYAEKDMEIEYKFCETVVDEKLGECKPGEVGATFKGMGIQASQLYKLSCRCADNQPYYLYENFVSGFKLTETYTCDMKTCAGEDPCLMTIDKKPSGSSGSQWRHPCRCPDGQKCVVGLNRVPRFASKEGYCQKP